jgi:hypothetical protein
LHVSISQSRRSEESDSLLCASQAIDQCSNGGAVHSDAFIVAHVTGVDEGRVDDRVSCRVGTHRCDYKPCSCMQICCIPSSLNSRHSTNIAHLVMQPASGRQETAIRQERVRHPSLAAVPRAHQNAPVPLQMNVSRHHPSATRSKAMRPTSGHCGMAAGLVRSYLGGHAHTVNRCRHDGYLSWCE